MAPENVQELYDALAAGGGEVPRDPKLTDALMDRVFEARRSTDMRDRIAALRVAEAVGDRSGLDLIETFMQDPAIEVRRFAFNLGLAAKADGLRIIREAAADPDPELASEALRLLALAVDRPSATRARILLSHDDARVRAAAVRLLGHIAGPSVRRELELQRDAGPAEVVDAANEALARLDGKLPKNRPGQWWDDAVSLPVDAPIPAQDRPPTALSSADTLNPEPAERSPFDSTWGPEVDSEGPVWGPIVPDAGEAPPPPGPAWDPKQPAALPSPLPTHAYALLRLLGMVGPDDRAAVLTALSRADPDALQENLTGHLPGRDPARGRGIALYAAAAEKKSLLANVRRLLADPEPLVRDAAVRAVGALGGPSTLTQVSGLLEDADPTVRVATIETLGDACARWNLLEILPQWLAQVAGDADPAVRAARDAVLKQAQTPRGA